MHSTHPSLVIVLHIYGTHVEYIVSYCKDMYYLLWNLNCKSLLFAYCLHSKSMHMLLWMSKIEEYWLFTVNVKIYIAVWCMPDILDYILIYSDYLRLVLSILIYWWWMMSKNIFIAFLYHIWILKDIRMRVKIGETQVIAHENKLLMLTWTVHSNRKQKIIPVLLIYSIM